MSHPQDHGHGAHPIQATLGHTHGHTNTVGHPGGGKGPIVRTLKHDLNKKPFIVIWEVTRACGLVCAHCRAEANTNAHPDQLTTEEGKALLDQLAAYEPPRPMVIFTGGDCFERSDLEELAEYGISQGLHISVSPSVTPLLTRERVEHLKRVGVKAMSVSLDGASPETHDAFRGFSGTYDATVKAAKMMVDVGMRVQVNSTLTLANIHEGPAMLKAAIETGAWMWYIFFLVPTGRGAMLAAMDAAQREDVLHWLHDVSTRIAIKTTEAPQYRRVAFQRQRGESTGERGELYRFLTEETTKLLGPIEEQPQRPARPPLAVNSGSGFAFIDHIGDVYPSGFLPIHCGNIKTKSFADIYCNAEVFKLLRDPSRWSGKCSVCEYNSFCGGSRSTAYALTGDPGASDPNCIYVPPTAATWTEEELLTKETARL